MTDLQKYDLVNSCETIEDLQAAIMKCADGLVIKGRAKSFNAERMQLAVESVINGYLPFNTLTRKWGIRQQALYLAHYKHK